MLVAEIQVVAGATHVVGLCVRVCVWMKLALLLPTWTGYIEGVRDNTTRATFNITYAHNVSKYAKMICVSVIHTHNRLHPFWFGIQSAVLHSDHGLIHTNHGRTHACLARTVSFGHKMEIKPCARRSSVTLRLFICRVSGSAGHAHRLTWSHHFVTRALFTIDGMETCGLAQFPR